MLYCGTHKTIITPLPSAQAFLYMRQSSLLQLDSLQVYCLASLTTLINFVSTCRKQKYLIHPQFTSCPAPNSRQTNWLVDKVKHWANKEVRYETETLQVARWTTLYAQYAVLNETEYSYQQSTEYSYWFLRMDNVGAEFNRDAVPSLLSV